MAVGRHLELPCAVRSEHKYHPWNLSSVSVSGIVLLLGARRCHFSDSDHRNSVGFSVAHNRFIAPNAACGLPYHLCSCGSLSGASHGWRFLGQARLFIWNCNP